MRVVGERAPFRLDDQEAVLGVGDDEVGLPLDRTVPAGQHPVDAVVDDVPIVELPEESFVQAALGRAVRGNHGEGHHPSHR